MNKISVFKIKNDFGNQYFAATLDQVKEYQTKTITFNKYQQEPELMQVEPIGLIYQPVWDRFKLLAISQDLRPILVEVKLIEYKPYPNPAIVIVDNTENFKVIPEEGARLIDLLIKSDSGTTEIPFTTLAKVVKATPLQKTVGEARGIYQPKTIEKLELTLEDNSKISVFACSCGYCEGYQYDILKTKNNAFKSLSSYLGD